MPAGSKDLHSEQPCSPTIFVSTHTHTHTEKMFSCRVDSRPQIMAGDVTL